MSTGREYVHRFTVDHGQLRLTTMVAGCEWSIVFNPAEARELAIGLLSAAQKAQAWIDEGKNESLINRK